MAILGTIFRRHSDEDRMLDRLRHGDKAAAEQLYRLHAGYLMAVCSRYLSDDEDVKDVMQEAFVKIFSSVDRFKPQGEGSLRAWMTRIAVNESINHIKANSRLPMTEMPENDIALADEEPDTEAVPAEVLHAFVRELPEGYRLVFNLYVMEGKSHKEIAGMLGIRVNTSASQLHKAKAALAAKVKQYIRENRA